MTQLEIDHDLYELLQARARKAGQSTDAWLRQQIETTGDPELNEFHIWLMRLVAHDVRTPLAAIMSSSELLKYYGDRLTDARKIEHLNTIQMQVRALNHLLDNVTVLQKIEHGTLVFSRQMQDLAGVCQAAVERAGEVSLGDRPIDLQVDDSLAPVAFDSWLLGLALLNLLLNALQYSPEDAPVRVILTAMPDQVVVRIMDEGIGIPLDEQERVFDLFYRASNAPETADQGLGLSVVRRVIDLHGGTIQIDSAPDEGTTITLTLPAAP